MQSNVSVIVQYIISWIISIPWNTHFCWKCYNSMVVNYATSYVQELNVAILFHLLTELVDTLMI